MILDTNAISALFEGNAAIAQILAGCDRPAIPVIALGEYRYGLQRSRQREHLQPLLETLVAESDVLVVDEETTASYSAVRSELSAAGRPIPENDVWIAALARQHALPLVSLDSHFDAVPGLERITWQRA